MRTNARWLALALTLAALLGLCLGAAAEEGTITFDKTVIGLPEAAVEKLSYRYLITLTGAEGLTGVETAIVDTALAGEAAEEDFALLPVTDSVLAVEGVRDGQTVILRGLPAGTAYTITETKADGDNPAQVYTCEADGALSLAVEGTVPGAETHHFVNRYKSIDLDVMTKTSVGAPGTYTFRTRVNTRDYLIREIWTSGGDPTYDTTKVVDADVSAPFTARAAESGWIFLTDPEGRLTEELTGTLTIGEGTADIEFDGRIWVTREGTFEMLVWEDEGSSPKVSYDLGLRIIRLEATNRGADYDLEWIDTRVQAEVMYQGEIEKRRDKEGTGFTNYGLGSLEIKKLVISGVPGDLDRPYTFSVSLQSASAANLGREYPYTVAGEAGSFTFDPVTGMAQISFTLRHGETALFPELPAATVWNVVETDNGGLLAVYSVDGVKAAGAVRAGSTDTAIQAGGTCSVVITNARPTTELLIDKTLVSLEPADAAERFAFTVRLYDGEQELSGVPGAVWAVTDAEEKPVDSGSAEAFPLTVRLRGGETACVSGLPAGVRYTVEEEPDERFGVVSIGAEGELTEEESARASFTNERRVGDLIVSKTVENPNAVTGVWPFRYTIETTPALTGVYGAVELTGGVGSFVLRNGESVLLTDLPVGTAWTVTERKAAEELPADVYTARAEGGEVTGTGEMRLSGVIGDREAETARADFINRFKPVRLTAEKTVSGLRDGVYTFRFTAVPKLDEEANENLDSAGAAIAVNTGAPYTDNYRLDDERQSAAAGIANTARAWKDWFWFVRGGEIADELRAEVTLTVLGGRTVSSAFTFDGELVILREGYVELLLQEEPDGETWPDVAFDSRRYVVRVGAKNRTAEDDYDVAVTDVWTLNERDGEQRRDPVGGVSFINSRRLTDLTVEKTAASPVEGDAERSFGFTLTLDEIPEEGLWHVVSAAGEIGPEQDITGTEVAFRLMSGEKAVFTGLPSGASYLVTEEADADFDVYAEDAVGVLRAEGGQTVRFRNTRKSIELRVRKIWDDADNAEGLRPESVTAVLTADGEPLASFPLNAGNGWSALVTGLPMTRDGEEIAYAWQEDESGLPEGYVLSSVSGEGGLTTLTNKLQRGGLIISKTVLRPNAVTAGKEFRFRLSVTPALNGVYGQVELKAGEGFFSLKNGQSVSVTGLPEGVHYTVTEIKAEAGAADDVYIASVTGAEGAVTPEGDLSVSGRIDGEGAAVQVIRYINRYISPELFFTKTVSGLQDGEYTFRFRLTAKTAEEDANENLNSSDEPITVNVEAPWTDNYKLDAERRSATAGVASTREADGSWLYLVRDGGIVPELKGEAVFRVTGGGTVTQRLTLDGEIVILKEGYVEFLLEEEDESDAYPAVAFDGRKYVARIGAKNRVDEDSYDIAVTDIWALVKKDGEFRRDPVGGMEFRNGRRTAELQIEKRVSSPIGADSRQPFAFSLYLTEAAPEGRYTLYRADGQAESPVAFTGSRIAFELKDGERVLVTGLPVGAGYTVSEQLNADFTVTVNGLAGSRVTGVIRENETPAHLFVNTRDLTEARVRKVWADNENAAGARPESVTVHLLANNQPTGRDAVLNESNGWYAAVGGLRATDDGRAIRYTWSEDVPAGYTLTQTAVSGSLTTLTNTYAPDRKQTQVRKVWNDQNDRDGLRPERVLVTLLRNGEPVGTWILSETNGWQATVGGLDEDAAYTWREDSVPAGYVLSTEETDRLTVLTNTHQPETRSLTVRKVWDDRDDQDGLRPESALVSLWADGARHGQYVLSAANGWTVSVSGLPAMRDGQAVQYVWTEDAVPAGYQLSVSESDTLTVLANTHSPETVDASVRKIWEDENNQDGLRPQSLTLALLRADGTPALLNGAPVRVTLSEDNGWRATVTGLARYDRGSLVAYRWTEENLPEGYTLTQVTLNGVLTTLTNAHEPILAEAEVRKVWNDKDNADGKRPESVTVMLMRGDAEIASYVLSEENAWHVKVEGLQGYADGRPIVYTWAEDEAALTAGYALTNVETVGTLTTLTNSRTSGALTVTKTVASPFEADHRRLYAFRVTLDQKLSGVYGEMTFTDGVAVFSLSSGEKKTAAGLPAGVTYTVEETDSSGLSVTSIGETGMIVSEQTHIAAFTNTHETVDVPVRKEWLDSRNADGIRPESVTVRLLADGVEIDSAKLDEAGGWKYVFLHLDKYAADGHVISYTVAEDEVKAYWTGVYENTRIENGSASSDGYLVRNIHEARTVEISGTKTWKDEDDQDGQRPVSITVHLLADGTTIDTRVVTAADGWRYTFSGLPAMAEGREIVYTVTEEPVLGYVSEISGYDILNSRETTQTRVAVVKQWSDSGNADGIRPASVTVHLLANGEDTGLSLTLSDSNNWNGSFTGLQAFSDGRKIVYTVKEDSVTGYTTWYEGTADTVITVVNRHNPYREDTSTPNPRVTPTPTVTPYVPRTGDETPLGLYIGLGAAALIALAAIAVAAGRRRKK